MKEIINTKFMISIFSILFCICDFFLLFYMPYESFWIPLVDNILVAFLIYIEYHLIFLTQFVYVFNWIRNEKNQNIVLLNTFRLFFVGWWISMVYSNLTIHTLFISWFKIFCMHAVLEPIFNFITKCISDEYKKFKIECGLAYQKHIVVRNV